MFDKDKTRYMAVQIKPLHSRVGSILGRNSIPQENRKAQKMIIIFLHMSCLEMLNTLDYLEHLKGEKGVVKVS